MHDIQLYTVITVILRIFISQIGQFTNHGLSKFQKPTNRYSGGFWTVFGWFWTVFGQFLAVFVAI